MGFTEMKGMEEVNIFKDDGTVIHIKTPKSAFVLPVVSCRAPPKLPAPSPRPTPLSVQMSVPSNTYVVSGPAETKKMEDLLPGILNQLGPESMDRLRDFATSQYGPGAGAGAGAAEEEEDDDDDVPDLVENFEVRVCVRVCFRGVLRKQCHPVVLTRLFFPFVAHLFFRRRQTPRSECCPSSVVSPLCYVISSVH